MKKIIIALLIVATTNAYAQKYKVKKGEILKDKEAVGTVVGKASMVSLTDIAVIQNGDTTVTVKETILKSKFPQLKPIITYTLDFKKLDQVVKTQVFYSLANEKQVFKYVFGDNNLHLYKNGFKIEEIEAFKATKAVSELDSTIEEFNNTIAFWSENLATNKYQPEDIFDQTVVTKLHEDPEDRPKNIPEGTTHLIWKKISDNILAEEYKLNDKNIYALIGTATHIKVVSEVSLSNKDNMMIYRKLDKPKTLGNDKYYYTPLSYTDFTDNFGDEKMLLYSNGAEIKYAYNYENSVMVNLNKMVDALEIAEEL